MKQELLFRFACFEQVENAESENRFEEPPEGFICFSCLYADGCRYGLRCELKNEWLVSAGCLTRCGKVVTRNNCLFHKT